MRQVVQKLAIDGSIVLTAAFRNFGAEDVNNANLYII